MASSDAPANPPSDAAGIPIAINGNPIMPEAQMPGGDLFTESARSNYVLIQFTKTEYPTPEQEQRLKELQVQFCSFIPPSTWLAKYEPSDLAPIRDLSFVLYANPYHDSLSLNPFWRDELVDADAEGRRPQGLVRAAAGVSPPPAPPKLKDVIIDLHPLSTAPEAMIEILVSKHNIPRDRLRVDLCAICASLTASEILRISKLDAVRTIEPEVLPGPSNHLARVNVRAPQAEVVYNRNLKNNLKLDGEGEVIAIADSGLDDGRKEKHPGDPTDIHPFFRGGRILHLDPRSEDNGFTFANLPTSRKNRADDWTGHGTHVCGTCLGSFDGLSAETQRDVRAQSSRVDGVAPKASFIVQAVFGCPVFDNTGENTLVMKLTATPNARLNLYLDPYYGYPAGGYTQTATWFQPTGARNQPKVARIHTNSYGSAPTTTSCGYTAVAKSLDLVVYNLPDYCMIFSAGNEGDNSRVLSDFPLGQINAEAAAKNVVTVGACFNGQFIDRKRYSNYKSADDGGAALETSFMPKSSSRGPVADVNFLIMPSDARDIIKPDIVAPGVGIFSAKSRNIVAGYPRDNQGVAPHPNEFCQFMSGTSMATPVVAGAAALIRQALRGRTRDAVTNPSAALIKALMVNGAVDITTTVPAGTALIWGLKNDTKDPMVIKPAPDDAQGWGMLNVEDSVDIATDTRLCALHDILPSWAGQGVQDPLLDPRLQPDKTPVDFHTYPVNIPAPPADVLKKTPGALANFKVTLAWTDIHGEGLQNRLSLHLVFDTQRAKHNVEVDVASTDATLRRIAKNNVQKLVVRDIVIPAKDVAASVKVVVKLQKSVADPVIATKLPIGYAICWKVWYGEKSEFQG